MSTASSAASSDNAHDADRAGLVHVADGEALVRREVDLGHGLGDLVAEPLVTDEDLGVAVIDDVGDLGPDQVVVDRCEVQTDLHGTEVQLDHLDAVGQHARDSVTRRQALGAQAVAHLVGRGEQLTRRALVVVGLDEGAARRQRPSLHSHVSASGPVASAPPNSTTWPRAAS